MEKKKSVRKSAILVTGGSGFIGSHVVDRLISLGKEVVIADNLSTGKKENINPRAHFYKLDIKDKKALEKIFRAYRIAYCIHEAAKINMNVMLEDPVKDTESSVLGTINVLQCCVNFKVKKIIYASSVAVYGRPKKLPAQETDILEPIYSYGIAKKCAEEYIRYYSDTYGLNYTILRYGNVYGPRQPIIGEVGVIAIFTERVIQNKPLTIFGDGNHLRDYIYIDDAAGATLKMLTVGDRQTFNVASGKGVSVNEIYDIFCALTGRNIPFRHKPERVGEIGKFYSSIGKISEYTGFVPKVSVEDGIKRAVCYFKYRAPEISDGNVTLRPARAEDKKMVFTWRNTPFLVNLGSSKRPVTWHEHSCWFDAMLLNKDSKLFIIGLGSELIGQLRFDFLGKKNYKVSIYILEQLTGQGIGRIALKKGLALMNKISHDSAFIAFIKSDNVNSQSFFSKMGFRKFTRGEDIPDNHIAMRYTAGS